MKQFNFVRTAVTWFRRHLNVTPADLVRLIALSVLAVFMFYPDMHSVMAAKFVLGFFACIALISHLTRKLLFPYVDLGDFFAEAKKTPLGAGLALIGVCFILGVCIFVAGQFFNR